jgi:2-(1,2-epoxy-1,2-dihydrophenyl)acetyl-CoA isomerase
MSVEGLQLRTEGAIARIIFDRPEKANAIRPDWMPAILRFLRDVEYDPAVRVVLISANGRHFQAGGDLNFDDTMKMPAVIGLMHDTMLEWNRVMMAIHRLPKPVIVAVQGGTIGASIALVAACDIVVAADDAFFISAQAKIASSLDGLPSYFLPRKIGLGRAMEWALFGDRIPAEEARAAGLVNKVVPRADLEASALALAGRLAIGPTAALGLTKRLLNTSFTNDIDTQSAAEMDAYAKVVATSDWNEGRHAFLEKRDARFEGR